MIPLQCLWAKSNNRLHGQFECDVTWFCFYFDFVRSHVRCDCCSIVGWKGLLGVGGGGWRPGVRLNYVLGPRGEKNFGRRWTGGTGGLKN